MSFQILLFFQFYVFQLIFMDVSLLKNLQTRKPVSMSSESDFFWTLQDLPSSKWIFFLVLLTWVSAVTGEEILDDGARE